MRRPPPKLRLRFKARAARPVTMPNPRAPARHRLIAAGLVLMAAVPGARAQVQTPPQSQPSQAQPQARDPAELQACIVTLRAELASHPQVTRDTFDTYTRGVQDLRGPIDNATRTQPEFRLAIWDYVARLADDQRAADGRQILQRESAALAAAERKHGVDPSTAVAVFGVETDYGRVPGKYPVVDATLSRACLNLDSKERKAHFFSALWLLQTGAVKQEEFRGSWAGAFGMTQFMPGTFVRYMDDGDGSGRADIVNSVPDALATTARYLAGLGWTAGVPWGAEVQAPRGLVTQWNALERDHGCFTGSDVARCKTIEQWTALGVAPVGRAGARLAWPAGTRAALFAPSGPDGPAWLVTRNFHALWGYNRADAYALAIGLLSDALRGDPPMQTPWPTDDAALSRRQFRELQAMLVARGFVNVVSDGHDGPNTREAVRTEERQRGLSETGRAGQRLFRLLTADAASAPVATPAASQAASSP